MREILVYSDGAATPNPGRGGYAAIIICEGAERVVCGGALLTTNNRMEIMAALAALATIEAPARVRVVSDSRYVVDGRRWAEGWRRRDWQTRGWRSRGGARARNSDLWARLLDECDRLGDVRFEWTRGHSGHALNERCDALAASAARAASEVDSGYEPSQTTNDEDGDAHA